MNTKIRFLVLDRTNTPVSPSSMGLHLAGVQSQKSPSILDEETATKFAQLLASRNPGQNYYVAKVIGAATAHDNLDAKLANTDGSRPVTFVATTAAGSGDE